MKSLWLCRESAPLLWEAKIPWVNVGGYTSEIWSINLSLNFPVRELHPLMTSVENRGW